MKPQQDKKTKQNEKKKRKTEKKSSFFYPNYCTNPRTTLGASAKISQAVSNPIRDLHHDKVYEKQPTQECGK